MLGTAKTATVQEAAAVEYVSDEAEQVNSLYDLPIATKSLGQRVAHRGRQRFELRAHESQVEK